MKVAVLTLSLYANYGGNLQAYALLTALKDLGHDAWFLNRERHKVPIWKVPAMLAKRLLKRYVLGQRVKIRDGLLDQKERAVIARHSRRFIAERIQPQTDEYLSSAALRKHMPGLDFGAVVVGSDQVWRQRFVKSNLTDYFCGFLPESDVRTRRVAYAASFGTAEWEYSPQETRRCASLAKRFHAISVREDTGVDQCRDHFDVSAEHVVDPTLLLTVERYTALIPDPERRFEGILVYILDLTAEKQKIVDQVALQLGLPVFFVNAKPAKDDTSIEGRVAPPVEDWLRGFRDAAFVITDSFHGTVFAILFNKPFIAYGNATRGMARFSSLLQMFGLCDRLVTGTDQLDDLALQSIEWSEVNRKLVSERSKGLEFLRNSLS